MATHAEGQSPANGKRNMSGKTRAIRNMSGKTRAILDGEASLTMLKSPVLEARYEEAVRAASSLVGLDQCLTWLDEAWQASAQVPQLISQGEMQEAEASAERMFQLVEAAISACPPSAESRPPGHKKSA